MKRIALVSVLTLIFLTVIFQRPTNAVEDGPSANGKFQFSLEDNNTRYLEFDARLHGTETKGTMTFSDPSAVVGETDSANVTVGGVVTAKFDCMKIEGNRAVMGGEVTESNLAALIGRRVLLVVEDNGEGINAPSTDRLTWGVYESTAPTWTPIDAERPDDIGATLTWIAKDAERPDDVGIPSNKSPIVSCSSFPLSSYSFVNVPHGSGNIQVKP